MVGFLVSHDLETGGDYYKVLYCQVCYIGNAWICLS